MSKKDLNPDKFLDKFRAFKREAKESDTSVEYAFVQWVGDDAEGEPTWSAENAENNFRNRIGGRYAIIRTDGDGNDEIVKETTITDEGERALARRGGRGRDPDVLTSAAIARVIGSMNDGFGHIIAREAQRGESYEAKWLAQVEENIELKEVIIQLKAKIEEGEGPLNADTIIKLIDRGFALFTGHATRTLIKERFGSESVQKRIVDAIGLENALKVAGILTEEFNQLGTGDGGLLGAIRKEH
jgi:hypothetical protein